MDLLKRRSEVANRAKVLCSVPNSGWHKNDPQMKGQTPLVEKLIGLKDDDRVYLVGECVPKALNGLQKYIDSVASIKKDARDREVDLEWSPVERHALMVCRRAVDGPGDKLSFPTQDWNGVLYALSQSGIQCVITDANVTPEEEKP